MKSILHILVLCILCSVRSFGSGPENSSGISIGFQNRLKSGYYTRTSVFTGEHSCLNFHGIGEGNNALRSLSCKNKGSNLPVHVDNANAWSGKSRAFLSQSLLKLEKYGSIQSAGIKKVLDVQEFASIDPGVAMLARVSERCWVGLNGSCRNASPLKILRNPDEVIKGICAGISLKIGISR
jgi:hypothetical protein